MSADKPLPEWMSDAEHEWRTRLRPVNLVIETDFTADEIRTAQSKYGAAVQGLRNRGFSYREIIKKYPALTLIILVGHAGLAYDQGKYWESFWDELDLSRDADFENDIRRSIFGLLNKFSLARFPDIERESGPKYVKVLALHAGVPVHCLADLLHIVGEHIAQGRDASGGALMAWLDEPGKDYRANSLDMPVRNFLMHGAEFAVDILDRIIEFVEATTADPQLFEAELDSSTTGLPDVLLGELIEELREKPVRWKSRSDSTGGVSRQPAISYSVDGDEIVLALPYPEIEPEVPWRVSFDGQVREVRAERKWGYVCQPPPTQAPVPGPVREIVVSHGPTAVSAVLPLVTKSDPLLVFSVDGRFVARRDGLKDAVWAVYPDDHQLVDLGTDSAIEDGAAGSPAGWHGWRSAHVELDTVSSLQLRRGGEPVGTPRLVRKDARPRFEMGEPISGVSSQGRPVHSLRPWVILPGSAADPAPVWRVRVRRVGAMDWLGDEHWDAEDVETCVDPFDFTDAPQLGLFEIVVSGPIGADARAVVFVAEGFWTEFDTAIRLPVPGGLQACFAEVGAESLTVTSEEHIAFGTIDLEKAVEVANDEAVVQFSLQPPHVEIRTGQVGSHSPWRTTPESVVPEDFLEDRLVAVRAPGIDRVEFGFVSAAGELVHIERQPRHKPGGVFEVRLQRYVDTARAYTTGRVIATIHTESGSSDITVLTVSPQRLGSGVQLADGSLQFDGLPDSDELATCVWCVTAPWRPAHVLPIVGGAAQLPADLVEAGALRCQVFIDDPWVQVELPQRPSEDAFRVDQPGWYRGGSSAQSMLSQFMAGQGPLPQGIGAVPEIWTALSWLHADGQHDRAARLVKLLAEEPRKALEGLGNSTIALHDKMAMLIRSELVNRRYASQETLNELHADPWFGCMVEMSDLPSLYHRRHEVREERAETLGYLSDKGGDLLIELLRSGKTAALHEGCFDRSVFAMSAMPPEQVEAMLREIELVPGPLLHPDTRFAAAYEAFCQRSNWMQSGWSENFAVQMSFVMEPIRRASALAYEAITIRNDRLHGVDVSTHPWMLMSLQSLTLAILARLEAHGRIGGEYLNAGMLLIWTRLAQLCPSMVATDLLIAEALISYDRRGNLIGEEQ